MYIHRNFTHPGGVSPMKQGGDMVTASDGSSVPRANLEDYENSLKEAKKEVAKEEVKEFISKPIINENVLNVAPGSGEIVDAKNTVKDLIAGDYHGASLNAAGFAIPFVPGSVIKKGVKAVMNYIRKTPGAEDAIKKGTKILDEGGSTGPKPKGGVDGGSVNPNTGYKYDMDVLDVDNPIPSFRKVDLDKVEIPRMKQLGKNLDANNFDASTLTKDNITFKGRSGGRTIVEVDLGNGQKQLFYKSTGSAKKAGSGVGGSTEGLWQPYAGHSSDAGKGWFGKDAGYKDWYKSQSYRDIAGNLDVLATKKGINLNMQMDLSTDLSKAAKSKPYSELTNADLDEAFANYKKRVGPDQADIANIKYD